MCDIVFKFNEHNEVYISEQKKHMYSIDGDYISYDGIDVYSDNLPEVSSSTLYIRGRNSECDFVTLISNNFVLSRRIKFIKGIIALITFDYIVGIEFNSGRKTQIDLSRKNDLLYLIEHTDVLMEDLISMFDKSGFSCKL